MTCDIPLALVTGATRGIGREVAFKLASDGWSLLLHGRNGDSLTDMVSLFKQNGWRAPQTFMADLSQSDECERFCAHLSAIGSRVTLVINNAGTGFTNAAPVDTWEKSPEFQVNLISPFTISRTLLDVMQIGKGVIVNVTSLANYPLDEPLGRVGSNNPFIVYGQTKRALAMVTAGLAAEARSKGLGILCVHPGSMIDTDLRRRMLQFVPEELRSTLFDDGPPPSAQDAAAFIYGLSGSFDASRDNGALHAFGKGVIAADFTLSDCKRLLDFLDGMETFRPTVPGFRTTKPNRDYAREA